MNIYGSSYPDANLFFGEGLIYSKCVLEIVSLLDSVPQWSIAISGLKIDISMKVAQP